MTLTNHIRCILDNATLVSDYADQRDFEHAHLSLIEISKHVIAVSNHLDHLQDVLPRAFVQEE